MHSFLDFLFPGRKKKKKASRYRRVEKVATGGMSEVWKARDTETGAICALKILEAETVELKRKFSKIFAAEEGKIALCLDHPNVVHTFDYGEADGYYFIVMEFIDGPDLANLITMRDPRVTENRFDLIIQGGRGLKYIHQKRLIHRDFCPKNILYDSTGTAKIIDFGLTIPAASRPRRMVDMSGTASYMAPEQIRRHNLDARTDIYAFGVTAFEILTGERPFPPTSNRERKLQYHLNVAPKRLRDVDEALPDELDGIVAKCIEKDPDLRYNSMTEVMRDLQRATRDL